MTYKKTLGLYSCIICEYYIFFHWLSWAIPLKSVCGEGKLVWMGVAKKWEFLYGGNNLQKYCMGSDWKKCIGKSGKQWYRGIYVV